MIKIVLISANFELITKWKKKKDHNIRKEKKSISIYLSIILKL